MPNNTVLSWQRPCCIAPDLGVYFYGEFRGYLNKTPRGFAFDDDNLLGGVLFRSLDVAQDWLTQYAIGTCPGAA